jgi:hypothetical protein
MERHGVEIGELLANRISPGPDIAIVRAALANLSEVDRDFTEREHAGRAASRPADQGQGQNVSLSVARGWT